MFIQQLINGLMLGSTYALIAIGYTLIFGVLNLVHLAHGEVFMIGAFIGLYAVLFFDVGIISSILIAMVAAAFVGILIELLAIRPIRARKGHMLAPMISTIGVGIVLQELATRFFGAEQVGFPSAFGGEPWHFGSITVTPVQLTILAVSIGLMAALHFFVTRTRVGMAMRATSESLIISHTLGIRTNRTILLTFAVASGLGGAAGVLVGYSFNAISPFMGIDMGIKGLAAMLLGGLGNIYGAALGGLIIGVAEVMSVGYVSSSYRDAFAFVIIIAVLLFRPEGIFGSRHHVEG
ncbi:branched-chain amino acid ABC transporter permease [Pusillimonas sp. DMV24BSW_D]|uniref:Branched-chain amino acid ABC transporter permease n=1 Tax=Neopusillimonas maritima TaxID=2026239 RepID=A0A3A1YN51_9BURK|nr:MULTISPECIES: branched-chain amino acid ABC transporter permease [Alcaligenaceae]QIM50054.1 branched-chain amino acid ABC transporter permease [Pusillimonas sp. DMV24BSW_D]RIY38981.1 branched-chain amino acid ABC transporter permease [Neopusillimonas maritima]